MWYSIILEVQIRLFALLLYEMYNTWTGYLYFECIH